MTYTHDYHNYRAWQVFVSLLEGSLFYIINLVYLFCCPCQDINYQNLRIKDSLIMWTIIDLSNRECKKFYVNFYIDF